MIIKTEDASQHDIYRLLIGSVLPRPIAWVSTLSKSGVSNLAPFSFFTVASAAPPILCFSPAFAKTEVVDGKEQVVPKDTLRNLQDTKEFVVNIVSYKLAEQMNQSAGEYPRDSSEFKATGLTEAPSQVVKPPRVGESLISMECKLFDVITFAKKPGGGNLVLGEIVCFHVDNSVYKDGRIDLDILQPIGRLGGNAYTRVNDVFEIERPVLS